MRRLMMTLFVLLLSVSVLAGCVTTSTPTGPDKVYQVGLSYIVEHPSLDAMRQGIIDGLAEVGFVDGQNIKLEQQSAQGEMPIAQQIAQKFVSDKKDMIIVITTPSSLAVAQATKEIPVVFGGVTDPVGAGLVDSWEKPGGNLTGVSDMSPIKEQLELFGELQTNAKRIGIIYSPGEANAVAVVEKAKEIAPSLGLTIVEATVNSANEVQQAAQSLVGRVDGFYLITDNTLAQGVQSVINLAIEQKLPTVGAVQAYVEQGALVTTGFDYYGLGKQTGFMAADVLRGKKPADMPVQTSHELNLVVNTRTAAAIGLTVPQSVLDKAAETIDQ
jgi:putative ABC transport system substrate-binding protein